MTLNEAVKKLEAMTAKTTPLGPDGKWLEYIDIEEVHQEAEEILLRYLEHHDAKEIADAFRTARDAIGFWYA